MGSIPGLAQWVRDPTLLWAVVWVADAAWVLSGCGCGVATVAVVPIGSLAWEPPCAVGVGLKKTKEKKKRKNQDKFNNSFSDNGAHMAVFLPPRPTLVLHFTVKAADNVLAEHTPRNKGLLWPL